MFELIGAFVALIAALVASYFYGKKKKREFLARVEAQPQDVARIYLRHAADVDAYWLHAEMKSGKKAQIAAPWEISGTLAKLASVGLQLSDEDKAAIAALSSRQETDREAAGRPARRGTECLTVTA